MRIRQTEPFSIVRRQTVQMEWEHSTCAPSFPLLRREMKVIGYRVHSSKIR